MKWDTDLSNFSVHRIIAMCLLLSEAIANISSSASGYLQKKNLKIITGRFSAALNIMKGWTHFHLIFIS
jgi:hypothetical protein